MNLDFQEKLRTSLMLEGNKDSHCGQDSENNTITCEGNYRTVTKSCIVSGFI